MKQKSGRDRSVEYLYPLVLKALNSETRREILDLLAKSPQKLSFSEIKAKFPRVKNASLANNLKTLQMADMVERMVKLEERRKNSNQYYCFYSLTPFGRRVNQGFREVVRKALSQPVKEEE